MILFVFAVPDEDEKNRAVAVVKILKSLETAGVERNERKIPSFPRSRQEQKGYTHTHTHRPGKKENLIELH
jgi:hypothetical protein